MRVAIVSPYDLGIHGGVQDQAIRLTRWLADLGHDPLLIGPGEEGPEDAVLLGATTREPCYDTHSRRPESCQTSQSRSDRCGRGSRPRAADAHRFDIGHCNPTHPFGGDLSCRPPEMGPVRLSLGFPALEEGSPEAGRCHNGQPCFRLGHRTIRVRKGDTQRNRCRGVWARGEGGKSRGLSWPR